MSIDRSIAPEFRIIKSVHLPDPQTYTLDNGIALHVINIGDQPVIRLECIYEAGNWFEKQTSASSFAIKMLPEGTKGKLSAEMSEAFDKIGAFIEMTHTADRIGIVVYALSRFLSDVLQLVHELIGEAVFPDKEYEDLRNITIQNLRINKEKNAYLATTAFRARLFGSDHPYGQSQEEEHVNSLSIEAVRDHYEEFIQNSKFTVVLAGQVADADIQAVNQYLGKDQVGEQILSTKNFTNPVYANDEVLVERPESVQSSIRMGRVMFNRHHPDYFKMLVTNEILGGYFGSRLMKNIREEKGLTYGISSHLVTLRKAGYYMIGTDVKKEFTQQTIDEIKKEINILQTELVGEEELQTVKNFMAGEFAGSLNTAFEIADRQKILLLDGLPTDFFNRYIDQIHATTSHDVIAMATQYLQPKDMLIVVAGGK